MTLPSVTPVNGCDDDSDMFGPPRSSPPIGYHHHRSRVPMISPKLRQREERKRILQLCAHKLERIKDSETNLRRSVCINNTYCRLTDELRREKQSRYLANLPRSESKPETARDNIFNPYNSCGIDNSNHHQLTANKAMAHGEHVAHQNPINSMKSIDHCSDSNVLQSNHCNMNIIINENSPCDSHSSASASLANTLTATTIATQTITATTISTTITTNATSSIRKRQLCSSNIDNDLEILDRELSAINSPMPLIDPEITQGAEQLEKAISSRKRQRSEDESDRLVREALSQFYIPPQRLISAIEDCPLDIVNMGSISPKCPKMPNGSNDLELDFDMNQNQKEFEVIMDALRLGSPSPTPSVGSDTCGQAAMMSETNGGVFHNLVVTSLET